MSGKNPIPTRDSQIYEGVNVLVPVGGWQVVRSKRNPTTSDKKYPVGTLWINTVLRNIWFLTAPAGLWTQLINSGTALVSAANGGTGVASPTAHAIGIAEGASPFTFITGTDGQVLTGNTGADPSFSAIGTKSGLTAHGVVLAEGASAFVATAAATNGQVLLGSTGADPAFGTLTSTTGISFTTGAASLALNITGGGFNVNAAATGTALVAQNSYNVVQAGLATFSLPVTAAVGSMYLITSAQSNAAGWTITQAASQKIWSNTSTTTTGVGGTLSGAKSTSVLLFCTVANLEFLILGNTAGLTFV